jgi:hypothetical protein
MINIKIFTLEGTLDFQLALLKNLIFRYFDKSNMKSTI